MVRKGLAWLSRLDDAAPIMKNKTVRRGACLLQCEQCLEVATQRVEVWYVPGCDAEEKDQITEAGISHRRFVRSSIQDFQAASAKAVLITMKVIAEVGLSGKEAPCFIRAPPHLLSEHGPTRLEHPYNLFG